MPTSAPQTKSGFAVQAPRLRDVTDRTLLVPHGVCIHTTGRGLPTRALKAVVDTLRWAEKEYTTPGAAFAHYVVGYDGTIIQIADERERAWHAGISDKEAVLYRSGRWRDRVTPEAFELWDARWASLEAKSPLDLFPGNSPNDAYLGVELIPLLEDRDDGTWFTDEQMHALSKLVTDIGIRYGINPHDTSRLVGHEDLEPLTRWDKDGGWDPGGLRARPRFDWARVVPVTTVPPPLHEEPVA